ncbi:MAG: hypothetical protein KF685_09115 [Acidobacteria bacterium]|nr:hypothetical protein [Acidobacteriota bacterium]
MQRFIILIAILAFVCFTAAAQEKPLTQPEYVKLLYAAENNAALTDELIMTVRRRGIDFSVTSGILSLTRTKSRNNADLRRALEESNRRRVEGPAASRFSKAEADELLKRTRGNSLASIEEMPDFVVKQLIQRSGSYAGTNNFRPLDRLVVAVSYRASGEEEYKVLSVNGLVQPNPEIKRSYSEVGGASSTGEFVTILSTVFKPENDTLFTMVDTDTIRDRRALMFDYEITKEKAKQVLSVGGLASDSTISGMKGRLWIDIEAGRVLRIESDATEIPKGFAMSAARRTIDYDWTMIGEQRYLLPSLSDVRMVQRYRDQMYESRNVIRFREYQKFGTEVIIGDDEDVVVEDQPN